MGIQPLTVVSSSLCQARMNTVRKETNLSMLQGVPVVPGCEDGGGEGPASFLPMGEIKACLCWGKVLEDRARPSAGAGSARSRCSNHLRILGSDGSLVAQRVKRLPEMWETGFGP